MELMNSDLSNELNVSNQGILIEFLVIYSRFEYALKRVGFLKTY
jgi:hypothetical protein